MTAPLPPGLTVGYVYSTALTSRIIEYYESSAGPSHATTLAEPGYVIDARLHGGVALRPVSYLDGSRVDWYRVPCGHEKAAQDIDFLRNQIGMPYSVGDIIGFLAPAMFRKHLPARHPWMCSWLQLAAEVAAGVLPELPGQLRRLDPYEALLCNCAAGAIKISGPEF